MVAGPQSSPMVSDESQPVVMQRANERSRVALDGRRTDDGNRCTLVAVCETDGTWALYTHGMAQLGVRIAKADAQTLAAAIQADGAR